MLRSRPPTDRVPPDRHTAARPFADGAAAAVVVAVFWLPMILAAPDWPRSAAGAALAAVTGGATLFRRRLPTLSTTVVGTTTVAGSVLGVCQDPVLGTMSKQEMIDWVRTNDLSALIRDGEQVEFSHSSEREVLAVRTVRLSAKVYDELQKLAEVQGIGTSVLMRQIIEQWVAAQLTPSGQSDVVPVTELLAFLQRAARPAA